MRCALGSGVHVNEEDHVRRAHVGMEGISLGIASRQKQIKEISQKLKRHILEGKGWSVKKLQQVDFIMLTAQLMGEYIVRVIRCFTFTSGVTCAEEKVEKDFSTRLVRTARGISAVLMYSDITYTISIRDSFCKEVAG